MSGWRTTPDKYNPAYHKRPLVCADEDRIQRAKDFARRKDLSAPARAALYFHELTGLPEFEFVAFSNLRLPGIIELPYGVVLCPCFVPRPEMEERFHEYIVDATRRMDAAARFIYDGGIRISDWEPTAVMEALRGIDEALSVFALRGPIAFEWEPKYLPAKHNASVHLSVADLKQVGDLSQHMESLGGKDRHAVYRSIGWLSQGIRLNGPAAKLLFYIVAIESLAVYIEGEAKATSLLRPLRSEQSTSEKEMEGIQKWIATLTNQQSIDDFKRTISQGYFDIVKSLRRTVEANLSNVFSPDDGPATLLFNRQGKNRSLYDLRSRVAHGSTDSLSAQERDVIRARLPEAEQIAQRYIMTVLTKALNIQPVTTSYMGSVAWDLMGNDYLNMIHSHDDGQRRPTHLAYLYM